MPPAARITDMHTCPAHGGGPIVSGEPTVLVGFLPAARITDQAICGPSVDVIAQGSPNVLIGYRNASRIGDSTVHGGVIVAGCPTVLIGGSAQSQTITAAAASGAPFCEECAKKAEEARQRAEAEAAAREQGGAAAATGGGGLGPPAVLDLPPAPSPATRRLAATTGNSPAQRRAREQVARHFLRSAGLPGHEVNEYLGVGRDGEPNTRIGPSGRAEYGIDLSQPVEVVRHPPPEVFTQYVRHDRPPGCWFDPLGDQTGQALGLNTDPAFRHPVRLALPPCESLQSTAGPITDTWTNPDKPTFLEGGGVQCTVPWTTASAARPCGAPEPAATS